MYAAMFPHADIWVMNNLAFINTSDIQRRDWVEIMDVWVVFFYISTELFIQ